MPIQGKRKCPLCNQYFNISQTEHIQRDARYYHRVCYDKSDLSNIDELRDYILELFGFEQLGPRINKQIKTYIDSGCTYNGILMTLKYAFEVKKDISIEKSNGGIGIVPYLYEEAKRYYAMLNQKEKHIEQQKAQVKQVENRTIEIDITKIKKPRRTRGELPLV